jgi:hypothetical protein
MLCDLVVRLNLFFFLGLQKRLLDFRPMKQADVHKQASNSSHGSRVRLDVNSC